MYHHYHSYPPLGIKGYKYFQWITGWQNGVEFFGYFLRISFTFLSNKYDSIRWYCTPINHFFQLQLSQLEQLFQVQQLMVMLKGNKIGNVVDKNKTNVAEMVKNNFVQNKINQNVKMNVQFVINIILLLLKKYILETNHVNLWHPVQIGGIQKGYPIFGQVGFQKSDISMLKL